ncbi:helix-turn-helix domain-containing protein [Pelagicoccus sp. NFK12]|uniref:Helix-turn-helix domain-containing protein n=1 Tax=Pelagicoccus enzymogenes TaxID=2773457 RepID=A0A927F8W4_9BACT|nr:AraC family transcriptional regulator [Pelagicoccus enzymogenes]MBD5780025.1 helix-turn-helix domain-containing protein [Pelagicoccus enzymogenes]
MDNISEITEAFKKEVRLFRTPQRVLSLARSRPFTADFLVTEVGNQNSSEPHERKGTPAAGRNRILFVAEGSGWMESRGLKRELKAKQAALIPKRTNCVYWPSPKSFWNLYWIDFESRGADALLSWTAFHPNSPILHCAASENLKRHFRAILGAVERGYTEHTTLQLSLSLIKILISLHENPLDMDNSRSTHRIETAMNSMRDDLSNPRSLETYAKLAGYSVTQFSQRFRQHTGTSPMNYLNELRIQRAGELLKSSDRAIKDIAHELGFEDPLYFSRCFRKCVGLSPRAYRER